jgi:hypothetical protein
VKIKVSGVPYEVETLALRKAAELALDALDIYREHDAENIGLADAAYEALRQALAQPEWVGLTDEDLEPMCDDWRIVFGSYVHDFAKAIEAKIKEKNT